MKALFEKRTLPWKNLVAVLLDPVSAMRGTVASLETKLIVNLAPHLLDIDGESCHHMHNILKKLTLIFDYFLENLLRDMYSEESMYSADSLDLLK